MSEVKGVIAVFIDERGSVIANCADFARDGYGGFTLKQAQRIRTKRRIAHCVMREYASPALTRAIDDYRAERIMDELCTSHGCKVEFIEIGHEDDDNAH